MLKSIEDSPLYRIANPRSFAFFGASNNFMSMGSIMLSSLLGGGFEGPIYPVHPKEELVQGLKAYRSVKDLPVAPDLAVLVLPTDIVNRTLEECGRKGIRRAIVVSGGFKEVGDRGVDLEKEMVRVAQEYDIRLIGPNCLGVTNPHHKMNPTPFPYEGSPGFIGLVSQSGSFVTQMFDYLKHLGLGFSTAFSVGNQANIDLVDCLAYLGACPHTKVIALYVEGLKRGRAFVETARSIIPEKPIVALYVGGSESGRRAGFSHTGAMAGPDRLYDGIFRQSGVIRAASLIEMFDYCWVLGTQPLAKGGRVVIQTHSGGPGATAADACGRAGLEMPPLAPETAAKLSPYVPSTGSLNNPLDLTFNKNPMDFFGPIPKILLEDPNADMLLVYFLMPLMKMQAMMENFKMTPEKAKEVGVQMIDGGSQAFTDLLQTYRKPIVGYTWRNLDEEMPLALMSKGIPVFTGPERAAGALGALLRYPALRDKIVRSVQAEGAGAADAGSD